MRYRLIGDIHGDFNFYKHAIKDAEKSIQLGDFGVGFYSHKTKIYTPELENIRYYGPLYEETFKEEGPNLNHRFIRGNHDNPEACKKNKLWIPDGSMVDHFFCVGGALSIDKEFRTEGIDYWADEELTQQEFYKIAEIYEAIKPDYVLSHECPESVAPHMFEWYSKLKFPSITRQGLQMLFEIHQPKYHFFGHWHFHRVEQIKGTTFVCVDINQVIDIDVNNG